jgi:hypothetical protein
MNGLNLDEKVGKVFYPIYWCPFLLPTHSTFKFQDLGSVLKNFVCCILGLRFRAK